MPKMIVYIKYLFVVVIFLVLRYMEEVIESTLHLLSFHHEHTSPATQKVLEPIHLLALLDIKATWFKKWMVSIANEQAFFELCRIPLCIYIIKLKSVYVLLTCTCPLILSHILSFILICCPLPPSAWMLQ